MKKVLEFSKFHLEHIRIFQMSLAPGTQIGRYEIISLVGSGGMGEVYLAKDSQFPRQVALKILPKTEGSERIQRFRQEARTISTLNHPNILSIYEFGEHKDFHFFATEYVKGKTLRQVMSEGVNLREAIEIAIQIGNALVVAHEAGIIHRDIKPENVMVLPDGYVKVLDFGLAKLSETGKSFLAGQDESTVSLINTTPGLITGTVSYMSPEQLRGQEVDARADIWSLGVVLYEMVTGCRPFTGESVSDVIAAVLAHPFQATADFPQRLEEILEKALGKEREERHSSAKDFVSELRSFRDELSNDTARISHQRKIPVKKPDEPPEIAGNSRIRPLLILIIILLLLSGTGGWLYFNRTRSSQSAEQVRTMRALSMSGTVLKAVLSPTGATYAYVHEESGLQSLRLHQVNSNGEITLVQPYNVIYAGIQFSPDGDSIFYSVFGEAPFGELYRIPTIGGAFPLKITDDVDSAVTFSPDGKQIAFFRTRSHDAADEIWVSNVDGSGQYLLYERKNSDKYMISGDLREGLAWSPDGKSIVCAAGTQDDSGEQMTVVEIDIANLTEREFTPLRWFRVGKVLWTKDGQNLIITAADFGSAPYQIFRLSVSNRMLKERITTDINDYVNISFTADSGALLAVVDDKAANLFTAPTKNPDLMTRIAGGNQQGIGGIAWTPEGKILYVSMQNGNRDIWITTADGTQPNPLTLDNASDEYPSISADGKYIAFLSSRTGNPHIWMMNPDGSDPRQLTYKGGEGFPQISPYGDLVFYTVKPLAMWEVSRSRVARKVIETPINWIAISPDGTKAAGVPLDNKGFRLSIFSLTDGHEIKSFKLSRDVGSPRFPPILRWSPDGSGIGYIVTSNGVSNIMVQGIYGGKPKKLTSFLIDRIFAFGWSKDGSKIAFAKGNADNKLVLFENF